jgi:hypothetical protein
MYHDPEIFDATVQNLDARTYWRPGFVHSRNNNLKFLFNKAMSANVDKSMRFDTDKKATQRQSGISLLIYRKIYA